jgi:stage II sporulation protein D
MKEPIINVGVVTSPTIEFAFLNTFSVNGESVIGRQSVSYQKGQILWNGRLYSQLLFTPHYAASSSFEIIDVTIGINFHWERKENQRFLGSLKIIIDDNEKLTAVNVIPIEKYLTSVISSEMSANASLELLKAHAVISRSWVLSNIGNQKNNDKESQTMIEDEDGYTKWYDRQAHTHFDVCADDHCQRYEGITRILTGKVKQAVVSTSGEILKYKGEICDARFSKCCGGVFEEFQNCWENKKLPYLHRKRDSLSVAWVPNLRHEADADHWIRTNPEAFCNTNDKKILSQILNNYDQETNDFYRWKVEYTQKEISQIVRDKSGIDFGDIVDLIPIERGTSGRIVRMKFVGTNKTMIIGKELEIRKLLSRSHLYSSAFVVDKYDYNEQHIPGRFELTGAGWGHGVGLCQIGAAVMGAKGYTYKEILNHYFKGATIEKQY